MLDNDDTIAALATPAGISAIALVRISGSNTKEIAGSLLGSLPHPRTATRADYRGQDRVLIDDVLVTLFAAPNSYTGEDTLEISTHGNPFIARKILDDLYTRGCRPAEPGEFTKRAFLNGKMDLAQAEAVMDIVHARSERALAAAHHQLRGSLGRQLQELIDGLLAALARVEAYIDFPEEDLPKEDNLLVASQIQDVLRGTTRLLATQRAGAWLREGIGTVIVGEPNAGKSSLLNALAGRERALVSPEPGTTRDFIEERLTLAGHSLRLIDTAGLNPHPADLERRGIEKTLEQAEGADLILLVLDATKPVPTWPPAVASRLAATNTIVVLNKSDLAKDKPVAIAPVGLPAVAVSALTGFGLADLEAQIRALADRFEALLGDDLVSVNARHALSLDQTRAALQEGLNNLAARGPVELLASDLRTALTCIGEISGKVDNERMLDHLFAAFCIGK